MISADSSSLEFNTSKNSMLQEASQWAIRAGKDTPTLMRLEIGLKQYSNWAVKAGRSWLAGLLSVQKSVELITRPSFLFICPAQIKLHRIDC